MRIPTMLRSVLIALTVWFGVGLHAAHADSGSVVLTVFKGGWIIGGSAGHGALHIGGRTYSLSVGGIDYGLVFGGSKTVLRGSVKNIKRASDIQSVSAAGGGGLAGGGRHRCLVRGARGGGRSCHRASRGGGLGGGAGRRGGGDDGQCGSQRTGDHDQLASGG